MVAEPAPLKLYLLGPPILEWAGGPLSIPRRQARALFYRLAAGLQKVPRAQLAFLFWPDMPDSTARRNLSHLLTHLRRALPDPNIIQTLEDQISLDPRYVWSDALTFERLYAQSQDQPRIEAVQQAVELYRGPLLEGFSLPGCEEYESWLLLEQRNFERRYLEALAELVEGWSAKEEYDKAISCARCYLDVDELAEDIHRRLIALYAAAGDRQTALRQFERCTAVLERELGVGPLPETRSLYQSILKGQTPDRQPLLQPPAWTTFTSSLKLPSSHVPLVGRDEALHRLAQAYAETRAGRGGAVLICGEAGIGKSRLMQDFATHLRDEAQVLAGACLAHEQTLPYQPIAQALRSVFHLEDLSFNTQPIWLAEASRLFPELPNLFPDLPPPQHAEPEVAHLRLFEALVQMLLGLVNEPYPTLLCIDDLHCADTTTLDWLVYLGQRLSGNRVLIIGAYRSEEAREVMALRSALRRMGVLSEISLTGLDPPSVAELLCHFAGPTSSESRFVERLQQATGGNPFFVLETLRALSEAGQLSGDLANLLELPLPDTVREAVASRLQRLNPVSRQVLEAAAVLGTSFDFDLVHMTAGRGEPTAAEGLEELADRQLLEVMSNTSGDTGSLAYHFQHEQTQQAVEKSLSPIRRQLLHRRAGRAYEKFDPDRVVALAHHFETGGETKKAIHYHQLAAQGAEALFAWQEAERHQVKALDLLALLDPDYLKPACLERRVQILISRAHHRYLMGRLAERDDDLEALADLAERSRNPDLLLQISLHRISYMNLDARYPEAIEEAKQALQLAEDQSNLSAKIQLLNQIGFAHYFLGQPRPALAILEPALEILSDSSPDLRRHLSHTLGYVYFHLGDYKRSLAYQEESHKGHRKTGDDNGMAWVGLDIGACYLELCHLAEARKHLVNSLELARRIGARSAEAYGLAWSGYLELYHGNFCAALDCFQHAVALEQDLRSAHGRATAEGGMGLVYYHLGNWNEARRWLAISVERARTINHQRRLIKALNGLGLVESAGKPLAAKAYLEEAVELARKSEFIEGLTSGLAGLAHARRLGGDPTGALDAAHETIICASEHALAACETWGELEAGLTLLNQGDPVAALEHTQRAIARVVDAHEGWMGSEEVYHAHARVLERLGQAETAAEYACRAQQIIADKAGRITDAETRRQYLRTRAGM